MNWTMNSSFWKGKSEKNNKVINKAFAKILNGKEKAKEESDDDGDLVGPPAPEFLKSTLNLLDLEEDETGKIVDKKENETIDKLINRTSVNKKEYINQTKKFKIEPINKVSYYKLIEEEKARMSQIEEELEDYENEFRRTSLLELHQQKKNERKERRIP